MTIPQPANNDSPESKAFVHAFPATPPKIGKYLYQIGEALETVFRNFRVDGEEWSGQVEVNPNLGGSIQITCYRLRPQTWLTILKDSMVRFNIFRIFEEHPSWALPVTLADAQKIQAMLEKETAGKNISVCHFTEKSISFANLEYIPEDEREFFLKRQKNPGIIYELRFYLSVENPRLLPD